MSCPDQLPLDLAATVPASDPFADLDDERALRQAADERRELPTLVLHRRPRPCRCQPCGLPLAGHDDRCARCGHRLAAGALELAWWSEEPEREDDGDPLEGEAP